MKPFFNLSSLLFTLCLTLSLCLFVSLSLLSCSEGTTPFPLPVISLSALDAGVTEVLLEVKVDNSRGSPQVSVERDGTEIRRLACADDSLFYDENLLPDQNYSYRAFLLEQGEKVYGTPEVRITTMDSTSHDFEWEIFNFGGQGASCTFYDVAIINENDIWAVGEIHTEDTGRYDSLGNWLDPYNAVHWDGINWELKRIYYIESGNKFWQSIPSIYAFNDGKIFFGNFTLWDNSQFISIKLNISFPSQSKKTWGRASDDFYIVGVEGLVAHYNGHIWKSITSVTDLPMRDIWGSKNSRTGQTEILCTASSPFEIIGKRVIQIENYTAKSLSDSGISDWVSSVWFMAGRKYYVAGSGIYVKNRLADAKWNNVSKGISNYYIHSIRGNDINDIFAGGGYGEILHFNGISWKSFFNETKLGYGNYYALDIKDNIVAAVGSDYRAAVIIIGKRN
jgi:hypothetical protein